MNDTLLMNRLPNSLQRISFSASNVAGLQQQHQQKNSSQQNGQNRLRGCENLVFIFVSRFAITSTEWYTWHS